MVVTYLFIERMSSVVTMTGLYAGGTNSKSIMTGYL